jgi:FMN reductase [NAD(P)H]
MSNTIDVLLSHRSYRDYTDQPVSDANLNVIIAAAHRAPSSINAQHVSLVVVRDATRRARIAEIAGGQPWIAKAPVFVCVVMDFSKTNAALESVGVTQVAHESLEGFAAGAIDSGIVLATIMTAARGLGLGTVPIGGIRNDSQAMIELLELPRLTFPIVGCSIGHFASEPQLKPRLPLHTFRHDEKWHGVPDIAAVQSYDETLLAYWKSIGRTDGLPWAQNTAAPYSKVYYRKTKHVAAQQGFAVDK